jgi:hypothetical protein
MNQVYLYIISFVVLFCAEICSTLHSLYAVKHRKHGVALFGSLSTALWCIKIVVVIDQPLTIITAFIGAYTGTLAAFYLNKKFKNE